MFKTILNYCVIVFQINSGILEVKCDILIENKMNIFSVFLLTHISALFMPKKYFLLLKHHSKGHHDVYTQKTDLQIK